ncbi:MAG: amino acid permease, partial [Bacteroidetes bacterium]|nr:amino acid permease [Bacteroidota bacterium]
MIKAKKFGAFAGVFTPSVLTILCVIMYMRLGWVVGQAGLIGALLIIVLAHVISISTGLSISSIATDKRIKAGGIYYILSRSLGLPIGGAIGIALLLGTALSISLYIIGFAENFLGLEVIRNFLGLEQNVVGIRIVGTAAFLILLIIAFISTSVAIKSQFYIMAAIGLSLVSIVIGLFINGSINPDSFSISYLHDGVSPEIIFAIFFPAVTGFTAGVAMSGDLKNPNKNIPRGTLAAIAVGFIIYSALAVGFALFVDRELLLTDYNFLMKIAWFAPLVVAGIWGATLSSAMGGILGGPRILQAISSDKITPKIFARGYGASNEPRNALLLIFVIAEAGILVGELDVIAGIVTMFYLVSYGMINIAFFLESWASVDFRPSFNVNRYIGLVGFIAAFGVMFQIDFILMFVAVGFMLILFFYLKRKELGSEYGDVWQSVYSSLMRATLHRMDHRKMEERNWQPNIVLFSGGTKKRPHLIDFGKALVGKHGVLSNFDLHESKHAKAPFPKPIHTQQSTEDETGVFTRRRTVRDIYDGIELISGIYGFSGFEPNSVLLGWGRHTRDPERFVEMLNNLYNLDLNVLLLDYDKRAGFGKFGTIDIWWKDISNQGNLALALSKLLLLSNSWESARIRLMIVNSDSDSAEQIHQEAEQLLDSLRIDATVKVINNQIEKRTFYEILLAESHSTDLVIAGIPEIEEGKEADFVEQTNNLLNQIGTVLLINASSTFKKERLFVDTHPYKQIPQDSGIDPTHEIKPSFEHVLPEEAPEELRELHASCLQLVHSLCYDYIQPAFTYNINKVAELENSISESLQTIESDPVQSLSEDQQTRQL